MLLNFIKFNAAVKRGKLWRLFRSSLLNDKGRILRRNVEKISTRRIIGKKKVHILESYQKNGWRPLSVGLIMKQCAIPLVKFSSSRKYDKIVQYFLRSIFEHKQMQILSWGRKIFERSVKLYISDFALQDVNRTRDAKLWIRSCWKRAK